MLSDWDGRSDKYARTIASWLLKLGWISQDRKTATATFGNTTYAQEIAQAYTITANGLRALRRAEGAGGNPRLPKNVFFEMLATKVSARNYLRLRRASILQALQTRARTVT